MSNGLHVAVIMDGNGRWARQRGLPRWRGHLAGVDSVRAAVECAPDLGIGTLTLYAFSSDNWKRPRGEVRRLFALLQQYCRRETPDLIQNGVRLTAIGRRDRIPRRALAALEAAEEATAGGNTLNLRLAIDYSARGEITRAVVQTARQVAEGTLDPAAVSADVLDTAITNGVVPPDLLIRTAGERRLSDFLLWELAYAELRFEPALWPDFRRPQLEAALEDFHGRERRFGGLGKDLRSTDRLAG
jgi:undecaprenyl diphosphate synthase